MTSNQYDAVLIRYGELSLKNNNRAEFERQLVSNIRHSVEPFDTGSVRRLEGAIMVELTEGSATSKVLEQLRSTPGIAWFAPCWTIPRDVEHAANTALNNAEERISRSQTFAVNTQRSAKDFPLDSMEINETVGGIIDDQTELSVDLDDPDWSIHVHLLNDFICLFYDRHEGMQGLPVESTGDVLVQLSGGIDSPVAAVETMKRGTRPDFIHFYPYASPEEALEQLMQPLVERLADFSTRGTLHLAPFYPFDLGLGEVPEEYEMILFRRHSHRVSETIANEHGLGAIVTGDSLGQVASQTLENIHTISTVSTLPLLRPLIGMNKNEIIDRARQYGTYELSITDYKDCCSIRSSHPKTTSAPAEIRAIEERHNLHELDHDVLKETVSIDFTTRGLSTPETVV